MVFEILRKIMVVDDDPDVIYSIRELFFTDFEIIGAESGKQCLHILETKKLEQTIVTHFPLDSSSDIRSV